MGVPRGVRFIGTEFVEIVIAGHRLNRRLLRRQRMLFLRRIIERLLARWSGPADAEVLDIAVDPATAATVADLMRDRRLRKTDSGVMSEDEMLGSV